MNEYISKYDQDELLYIKERLLGKELWVYGSIRNYAKFFKSIDESSHKDNIELWKNSNENLMWYNPNKRARGGQRDFKRVSERSIFRIGSEAQ